MAMARAEMSLAAVPASTAGNENSRVHTTIDQELKTLADAMFQLAERLTEISHKSLPLRKAIDLLKKIQTDSTQDAANDQPITDETDCCMGISDDLISVDKRGEKLPVLRGTDPHPQTEPRHCRWCGRQ